MSTLDPTLAALVEDLKGRIDRITSSIPVENPVEFVLLRSTPGHGKTRVVQELYERLREQQSSPRFWPPLLGAQSAASLLDSRHRVFPRPQTDFADHDPDSEMDYLWWGIECDVSTAASDPLNVAIGLQLAYLAEPLLAAEIRAGQRLLDKSGEINDAASITLTILSTAGVAIPVFGPGVAAVSAALLGARRLQVRHEHRVAEARARDIHGAANATESLERLADNLAKLSKDLPVVLVVDNAHLADERLTTFLGLLAERRGRILVLLTAWPDESPETPFARWWGDLTGHRAEEAQEAPKEVVLEPLSVTTLEAIFDEDLPAVTPAVRQMIIAEIDGNPLALRANLMNEGIREDALAGDLASLEENLARDVDEAFRKFWKAFSDEVRHALALASYLGRDYVEMILLEAVGTRGPFGHLDRDGAENGLATGLTTGYVRDLDAWLRGFTERTFYELAHEHVRKVSRDGPPAIREALEAFLRAEHHEFSPRALAVLQTRYVEFAIEYPNLDARLATETAIHLSESHRAEGDLSRAERASVQAVTLADRLGVEGSKTQMLARWERGSVLSVTGRYEDALTLREVVLTAYSAQFPPEHPDVLRAKANLANTYYALGRHEEALSLQEVVLTAYSAQFPPEHPDVLTAKANLAITNSAIGRHEEALSLQEEVLTAFSAKFPPEHPIVLRVKANLAATFSGLGRYEEALTLQEEVLAAYSAKFPPEHPDVLRAKANLANTYYVLGRHEEALSLQEEVLTAFSAKFPPEHPDVLRARTNLAITYSALGRHEEAHQLRRKSETDG